MKIHRGSVLALALSGLALAGCAAPPVLAVLVNVVDGMTLLGTGKTMSDHALSAVADQDCALWRVVSGKTVCVEWAGPTVAAQPAAAGDETPVAAEVPEAAAAAPSRDLARDLVEAEPVPVVSSDVLKSAQLEAPPVPETPPIPVVPVPPRLRALLTVPDPVPPPRAKPVQVAEVPVPPHLPARR